MTAMFAAAMVFRIVGHPRESPDSHSGGAERSTENHSTSYGCSLSAAEGGTQCQKA